MTSTLLSDSRAASDERRVLRFPGFRQDFMDARFIRAPDCEVARADLP